MPYNIQKETAHTNKHFRFQMARIFPMCAATFLFVHLQLGVHMIRIVHCRLEASLARWPQVHLYKEGELTTQLSDLTEQWELLIQLLHKHDLECLLVSFLHVINGSDLNFRRKHVGNTQSRMKTVNVTLR